MRLLLTTISYGLKQLLVKLFLVAVLVVMRFGIRHQRDFFIGVFICSTTKNGDDFFTNCHVVISPLWLKIYFSVFIPDCAIGKTDHDDFSVPDGNIGNNSANHKTVFEK